MPMSRQGQRAERAAGAECHTRVLFLHAGLLVPKSSSRKSSKASGKLPGEEKKKKDGVLPPLSQGKKGKAAAGSLLWHGQPSSGIQWAHALVRVLPRLQPAPKLCPPAGHSLLSPHLGGFPRTEPWDGKWPRCLCRRMGVRDPAHRPGTDVGSSSTLLLTMCVLSSLSGIARPAFHRALEYREIRDPTAEGNKSTGEQEEGWDQVRPEAHSRSCTQFFSSQQGAPRPAPNTPGWGRLAVLKAPRSGGWGRWCAIRVTS